MSQITIRNYTLEFPYEQPYDIQTKYMEKVLECLDGRTHGVLESPTGTGKTLCLFAPVAAWVRKKKEQDINASRGDNKMDFESEFEVEALRAKLKEANTWGFKTKGRVWYTARTHSQLAQTVAEVRKCNIQGLKISIMGARDQLCIHPEVLSEKDSYVKTIKCKELTKAKKCSYYNRIVHDKESIGYFQPGEVMDIEDLVAAGKSCGRCPYFMAKKGAEEADIVLLPYNYIIDKDSREANGFDLNNDVVIFDEGHNIPNTCEEAYEFEIKSVDIALGIRNMKELMLHLSKLSEMATDEDEMEIAVHAQNSMFMMEVLKKLETGLESLPMLNHLSPVSLLYKFFEQAGITYETSNKLRESIEGFKTDSVKLALTGSIITTFHLLEKMMHVIFGPTVRSFDESTIERSFKCGIVVDDDYGTKSKKISLFCFNPSFGIQSLLQLGVSSLIITSGTLSPLNTFIHELDLPNPVRLENRHIAKSCQVPFMILGTGVNNVQMDAAFKNRNDPKYVFSLGMTLTNLIASVPDGVLLLFSSYSMMKSLKESWESNLGIWARLNSLKRVFIEQKGKDEFINCMENYKRAIDAGNGAVLMGVLRGKISEGMDFKNQYCRAVFIVGVPFPPINDPRVKGKGVYSETLTVVNATTKRMEKLYKCPFMSVEAMKATNQAIGRVIRHGNDYGSIILVDYRFSWPNLFCNISSWVRGETPTVKNFPEAKRVLREFFKDVYTGKLGVPEIRCQRVDNNGCPVPGYVTYEEYDHKKAVRTPAPFISASLPRLPSILDNVKPKGCSNIEYVDDEPVIVSTYFENASKSDYLKETLKEQSSTSLLEALESSRSTSIGYREFDVNMFDFQKEENSKRKFCEDGDSFSPLPKSPCVEKISPSLLSSNRSSETQKLRKKGLGQFSRLKVRDFVASIEPEHKSILQPIEIPDASDPQTSSNKPVENEEETSRKLRNYFSTAKEKLSKNEAEEFKNVSLKYMRGESPLTDVLGTLDKLFRQRDRESLFKGFGICVKKKDKIQWDDACFVRRIFDIS